MLPMWTNPYTDLDPTSESSTVEEKTTILSMQDIHRSIVPLRVVNAARYQNGPLPVLAPVATFRERKISTAPPRYSQRTR